MVVHDETVNLIHVSINISQVKFIVFDKIISIRNLKSCLSNLKKMIGRRARVEEERSKKSKKTNSIHKKFREKRNLGIT